MPGFIITEDYDTIHGFIENRETRSLNRVCHFKENAEAEVVIFTPMDIAGYRFSDGRYFVSRIVDELDTDQPVFLEFLVEGEISFFHFLDTQSRYFILKDGQFHELKNTTKIVTSDMRNFQNRNFQFERKEYIGVLNYLLDNADIKKNIDRSDLTAKSLINLAIDYQAIVCPDEECILYKNLSPPLLITYGFQAGFASNRISFGGRINSNFSPGFYAGLLFRFENAIRWSENILIEAQMNIQKFTYYSLSAGANEDFRNRIITYKGETILLKPPSIREPIPASTRVNLNTTALKVPLIFIYRLPGSVYNPYFGIGLTTMFILNQTDDLNFQLFYIYFNKNIPTFHFGPKIAAGTTIKLKSFKDLSLGISYEHTESTNINQMLRFRNQQFSFDFAFHF